MVAYFLDVIEGHIQGNTRHGVDRAKQLHRYIVEGHGQRPILENGKSCTDRTGNYLSIGPNQS